MRQTKQVEHTEVINGVTYTLAITEEDTPIQGNASAFGNELDREVEDDINRALGAGHLWSWCTVVVTASIEHDGERFEGIETLGCCSYSGVTEFMAEDGYYPDMRDEAWADLQLEMVAASQRGECASHVLIHELYPPARAKKIAK